MELGDRFACAIVGVNNKLMCWGNSSLIVNSSTPVEVISSGVVKVSIGDDHICAIVGAIGELKCWGFAQNGKLGTGTLNSPGGPTTVIASGVTDVAATRDSTCAIANSGNLYCWGSNEQGQFGNGGMFKVQPTLLSLPN